MKRAALRRGAAGLLTGLALLMVACSSGRPKPTPLESFTPQSSVRPAWQADVGDVRFPLQVAARGDRFIVASSDGTVMALRATDGQVAWRVSVAGGLSAGVGSDGRFTSVVTNGNEVVVLDGEREIWRQRIPARVVTPPLVAGERVFVMSVDRAVHAFDALDGRRLWTLQRPGDALTLLQAGVLTSYRNLLIVGQGPRLTAVDPLRGTVQWEVPLATPRGTNEVERLADLIGPAVRVGERLCARSFQSAAGCVDAERAAPLWSRGSGGAQAVAADDQRVVGADASDRITAWRTTNGDVLWSNERLLNRGLSGGLMLGSAVAFGDLEGQVHLLAADTGQTVQRFATDGSPVVGTPVRIGNLMLVTTRKGGLFAFRGD